MPSSVQDTQYLFSDGRQVLKCENRPIGAVADRLSRSRFQLMEPYLQLQYPEGRCIIQLGARNADRISRPITRRLLQGPALRIRIHEGALISFTGGNPEASRITDGV